MSTKWRGPQRAIEQPTTIQDELPRRQLITELSYGSLFGKWVAIALATQFFAWLLMLVVIPFRRVYYAVYMPLFHMAPGPHFDRYEWSFFMFFLPFVGSIGYAILVGSIAVAIGFGKKRMNRNDLSSQSADPNQD